MTKCDLINLISEKANISRAKSLLVVDTVFSSMIETLKRGDRIEIRTFGSFEIRAYEGYQGRNPKTGEVIMVAPKLLPHFKTGIELKERIDPKNKRESKY